MGETGNIAKIAELVSKDIFQAFGWEISGSMNINWSCVKDEHGRATHPADVVYKYPEPYHNKVTFIHCDLKSYSKDSITKASIKSALKSLNESLSCAKVSSDWRDKFLTTEKRYDIKGMLFVYNHDGEFSQEDQSFSTLLDESTKKLEIDEGNVIYVVGPSKINYLTNVSSNIKMLCAEKKLPFERSKIGFYYPELDREKIYHNPGSLPLSIEKMCGSFHVMRYDKVDGDKIDGLDVYMQSNGSDTEQFMHILDFIRLNNCLQDATKIRIFLPFGCATAHRNFDKALSFYTDGLDKTAANSIKEQVKFEHCPTLVKLSYFNEEIGMRHE